MNVVSNESAPSLIGLDVIRECGLVTDYHYNRVHSQTYLLCAVLPTGNLALEMMPSKHEWGQRPASSHALSTGRWGQQPRARKEGMLSLGSSASHLREEESEHEHERSSASEGGLLKMSDMPEDAQT